MLRRRDKVLHVGDDPKLARVIFARRVACRLDGVDPTLQRAKVAVQRCDVLRRWRRSRVVNAEHHDSHACVERGNVRQQARIFRLERARVPAYLHAAGHRPRSLHNRCQVSLHLRECLHRVVERLLHVLPHAKAARLMRHEQLPVTLPHEVDFLQRMADTLAVRAVLTEFGMLARLHTAEDIVI